MSYEIRDRKLTPSEKRALTFMKEPAESIGELWERYPNGGLPGWYCFVMDERNFVYWDSGNESWTSIDGGGARGLSAYEIAVRNGFRGTKEEWLESLRGATPAIDPVSGNWVVSGVDTGISARGIKGDSGESLTYDDLTPGQIAELQRPAMEAIPTLEAKVDMKVKDEVAKQITNPATISGEEKKVGTIIIYGEEYDLYECTVLLQGLPLVVDEVKGYELTYPEFIGGMIYTSVKQFAILQPNIGPKYHTMDYFNGYYNIVNVMLPVSIDHYGIAVKCVREVPVNPGETRRLDMMLTLSYCKFQGRKFNFKVYFKNGFRISSQNFQPIQSILKYGKKLVFSWINDDSCSIWNYVFSLINKRWIDEGKMSFFVPGDNRMFFPHMNWAYKGVSKTNGYTPSKFLEYTDGCGVKHRFTTSVASWADKMGGRDEDPGIFFPWNGAKEMRYMQDFGFTVLYHNLLNYTESTQKAFDTAVKITANAFKNLIDVEPFVMAEPDGDHNYIAFGKNNPVIKLTLAQGGESSIKMVYPFSADFTLDKHTVTPQRIFASGTPGEYITDIISRLQTAHDSNDNSTIPWVIGSAHKASDSLDSELLRQIEERFGATGDDSVWVTTPDEFLEHWFMSSNMYCSTDVNDDLANIDILVPILKNAKFPSLSFFLPVPSLNYVERIVSDDCDGISYGIKDGKLLVNMNFDPELLNKVEKYVARYETDQSVYNHEDAMYFVQLLKSSLQQPFLDRIDAAGGAAPILNSISINNGSVTTTNRSVVITCNKTGSATHYMIGEAVDLSDGTWLEYVENIPYELSGGYTAKTVYVKIKNAIGESDIISSTIQLQEPSPTEIPVTGLSLSTTDETSIRVGEQLRLTVSFAPENTTQTDITWESSNNSIATVQNGVVTGLSTGGALSALVAIKVKSVDNPTVESSINITVTPAATVQTEILLSALGTLINGGYVEADPVSGKYINSANMDGVTIGGQTALYDSNGNLLEGFRIMTKEERAIENGGVTPDSFIMVTGDNPTLTQEGLSVDLHYLNQYKYAFKYNSTTRPLYGLIVPNGTYSIKLYSSTGRADVMSSDGHVEIKGIEQAMPTPAFSLQNNKQPIEFNNIVVENGKLLIRIWSEKSKRFGINFMEISKI